MEQIRLAEKKLTVRLLMDLEMHQEVYENIMKRDRQKYRTITDYIVAAVLNMENGSDIRINEEDRKLLAKEIADAIADQKQLYQKPAL